MIISFTILSIQLKHIPDEFKKLAKGSNEVVRQDSAQIIPISRKFDPLKARSFFKPLS